MSQIAQRYGQALFDLALEHSCLEAIARDFSNLLKGIQENEELSVFLKGQRFGRRAQVNALLEVLGAIKAHDLMKNFASVLAERGRLAWLKEIGSVFLNKMRAYQGFMHVLVTSANTLTKAEVKNLQKLLEEKLEKKVVLDCQVDEELIGGLTVKVGSLLIDGSYKTKLIKLHHMLRGVN